MLWILSMVSVHSSFAESGLDPAALSGTQTPLTSSLVADCLTLPPEDKDPIVDMLVICNIWL